MKIEKERAFEIFNAGSKDRIDVLNIANIVIKELLLDNVSIRLTGGVEGRGWKGDVKEMLARFLQAKGFWMDVECIVVGKQ